MSEPTEGPSISLAAFVDEMERFLAPIQTGREFTPDEYLNIGRLWNTILYYTALQSTPNGALFFQIVRDQELQRMVAALEMTVSRGYSFKSDKYDFAVGGTLDERHRYRITDPPRATSE